MIWFITGTGFYDYPGMEKKIVKTKFGDAEVLVWKIEGKDIAIICRHWETHQYLPNHINFRANIMALKELWVNSILSFSVAWVINADLDLNMGSTINDLYTPDNRLPNWEICTFFNKPWEKGRWHLIAESFYNSKMNADIKEIMWENLVENSTYVYSIWPRFNSKAEIRGFKNLWGDYVSQTCWPEAILSWELEIPYAQFVYWVDYANWIKSEPTPLEELSQNLENSTPVFKKVLRWLLKKDTKYSFEWFVYRFY
jgi:5'-methylthioadenosine phosphorylase